MKRRRRKVTRFRRLVVLTIVTALAAYAYWALALPMGGGHARQVDVKPGQSARAVASELQREGAIRSRVAFLALAYVTRKAKHCGPGPMNFRRGSAGRRCWTQCIRESAGRGFG